MVQTKRFNYRPYGSILNNFRQTEIKILIWAVKCLVLKKKLNVLCSLQFPTHCLLILSQPRYCPSGEYIEIESTKLNCVKLGMIKQGEIVPALPCLFLPLLRWRRRRVIWDMGKLSWIIYERGPEATCECSSGEDLPTQMLRKSLESSIYGRI